MSEDNQVASRESKREGDKSDAEFVRLWLDAIELSSKEEEAWRKRAGDTVNIYRSGSVKGDASKRSHSFNILYSNVETTTPAIYNSVPVPDVRRRFSDDDPVGKEVCDLIERGISYSVDSYDFDAVLRAAVQDMEIPGRGVTRIRWQPYLDEAGEAKVYEEVACEHVQWKQFRRGPGRTWADLPWIAFELFLGREELNKLSPKKGASVKLDCTLDGVKDTGNGENVKEIFKRARVWEIWDKDSRKVIFIAESTKDGPLLVTDDPLELTGFFPIPRPLYGIETTSDLTPVIPYDQYRDQAEELERISERIIALVSALKARGVYDGQMPEINRLSNADDNDLIAIENAMAYADKGGLEKAILWFPLETIAAVLEKLYVQRDQTKQTIYEITGIADILRGATEAQETATAQKIKSEWGSLRIQRKQMEVQRYARDLFRLKAELIATKFDWQTISMMTGLQYPSQADQQQAKAMLSQLQQAQQSGIQVPPQIAQQAQAVLSKPSMEEVDKVLRNDTMRGFRIDVESDSTIRADMTRNQQMMTQFLEGSAAYMQAIGPAVQAGMFPPDIAVEVYTAFARNFRLGKQAEDALDRLADQAKKTAEQPPKPDPKIELEKQKLEHDKEKMGLELQIKQAELQLKEREAQAKLELEREKAALEMQIEQMKADHEMKIEAAKAQQQAEIAQQEAAMNAQIKQTQAQEDIQIRRAEGTQKLEAQRTEAEMKRAMQAQSFAADEQRKTESHKAEQKRRDALAPGESRARSDHEAKIRERDAEHERKARDEERKKPKALRKATVIRDKDGRIAGAEIQ